MLALEVKKLHQDDGTKEVRFRIVYAGTTCIALVSPVLALDKRFMLALDKEKAQRLLIERVLAPRSIAEPPGFISKTEALTCISLCEKAGIEVLPYESVPEASVRG